MKKVFHSKAFWVTSLVAVSVVFAALINLNRVYSSETTLLVVPKSTEAIENSDQIIENLRQLPLSLNFYNRMMEENQDLEDERILEKSASKKKNYWKEKVKAERVGTSGILKISVYDKNAYLAENLSIATSETLIGMVGIYYDIKNDVDVRIVDSAITEYVDVKNRQILFLESLFTIFPLSFLVFLITLSFSGQIAEKRMQINWQPKFPFGSQIETSDDLEEKNEIEEKSFDEADENEDEIFPLDEEKNISIPEREPESSPAIGKTAAAPDNLPFAFSGEIPGINLSSIEAENEKEEKIEAEDTVETLNNNFSIEVEASEENSEKVEEKLSATREATPDEVKERLNKLLSGKL